VNAVGDSFVQKGQSARMKRRLRACHPLAFPNIPAARLFLLNDSSTGSIHTHRDVRSTLEIEEIERSLPAIR
jgi:hypothetical protein